MALLAMLVAMVLAGETVAAQCVGDCDGSGRVTVGELIVGVNIALGERPLADCPSFDRNGNLRVDINELLAAVGAALAACPSPEASATPEASETPTETATATPTATPNLPPVVEAVPIYRTFPGFEVRLPLPVRDPEERELDCQVSDLPDGAAYDPQSLSVNWTPTQDQIGPFYIPFSCEDDAEQPATGELIFRVTPLDDCSIPSCDPATGCTVELLPAAEDCCVGEPTLRVVEPDAPCPQGLVLYTGRNTDGSFGRLQNCDMLRMNVFAQQGASVQFNVETRCVNTAKPVRVHARIASATRGLLFDYAIAGVFLQPRADGFQQRTLPRFTFGVAGPFFEFEDREANLHVTLTDGDGVAVQESVRVILTSTRIPDLPDAGSTPTPTPVAATPTPGME